MKRGLGQGSWRSTKQLRESTRIMERLLWFSKNVRMQPINNQQGHTTTIYEHFVKEDEKVRLERDTKSQEIAGSDNHRLITYRFLPQLVKN